ncbi:hypothetical protein ACTXT7_001952 [Hymenolepis weldensis]
MSITSAHLDVGTNYYKDSCGIRAFSFGPSDKLPLGYGDLIMIDFPCRQDRQTKATSNFNEFQ